MGSRGPVRGVMIRPAQRVGVWSGGGGGSEGGISCCCCRCCTCLNLQYLRSPQGALKMAQVVCGAMCQALLLGFGTGSAERLGFALLSFLITVSSCGFVVWLLLATYVCSESSQRAVRASLLEPLFNTTAAFLYLSASSWVAWRVIRILLPMYQTIVFFESYPAMTSAYIFGLMLGILHSVDGYIAWKHFRSSSFC